MHSYINSGNLVSRNNFFDLGTKISELSMVQRKKLWNFLDLLCFFITLYKLQSILLLFKMCKFIF